MRSKNKRPRSKFKDERPADLLFWFRDGECAHYGARFAAEAKVEIGRTNSKRALGFIVSRGATRMDFVLDRDQVAELVAYFHIAHPRLLKPLGRKKNEVSLVASAGGQW